MSLGPLAYAPGRTATLRRPLVRFSTNNVVHPGHQALAGG